jgi:hydroxyacylglutathione hydrolase
MSSVKIMEQEMTPEIRIISLGSVIGSVNCYLVKAGEVFVLIDTGFSNRRANLEKELTSAGCKPGNLKLIVLTHGDIDHAGNSAYLRAKYWAKIAIHRGESKVVQRGDMLLSRRTRPLLARIALSLFMLGKSDRFEPDIYVDDGYDLSGYGFDAQVLHVPGHSQGSIAVLTKGGDLFCGDLLVNTQKPAKNSLVDDAAELNASVKRLRSLRIKTVYPGHGKPFPMEMLTNEEFESNDKRES